MARFGILMYRASYVTKVFVTIEEPGKPPRIELWSGRSARAIHAAARKKFPGAHVQFGRSWDVAR